jgi:hypothetical protein
MNWKIPLNCLVSQPFCHKYNQYSRGNIPLPSLNFLCILSKTVAPKIFTFIACLALRISVALCDQIWMHYCENCGREATNADRKKTITKHSTTLCQSRIERKNQLIAPSVRARRNLRPAVGAFENDATKSAENPVTVLRESRILVFC